MKEVGYRSGRSLRKSVTHSARRGVAALCLATGLTVFAGPNDAALHNVLVQLEALRRQVVAQQQEIDRLKARLDAKDGVDRQAVERGVDAKPAEKETPRLVLRHGVDDLRIRGDFFVRYERRTRDTGKAANPEENRDRLRSRLRLGLVWTDLPERWEVGIGLATGTVIGHGCTDTWSEQEVFETSDIRLDYAYARQEWDHLSLTIGQQINPFHTTQMVWDKDYRPVGFTAQACVGDAFAILGWYDVLWGPNLKKDADDADVFLYAAQIGRSWKFGTHTRALAAASAYFLSDSFRDATPRAADDYDPYKYSAGLYTVDEAYHVHLCDLYAQLLTRVGPVDLKFYTQITKNVGAAGANSQQGGGIDPGENDLAWLLGLDAKYRKFKFRCYHTRIEADSVFGPFKFDTFGAGAGLTDTNIEGEYLGLYYALTPHLSLAAKAMLLDQIAGDRDAQLYQLDAVYKF